MASAKDRWLSDLVGTTRSFFRLGKTGVRLKDASGVLQIRDSGDTADAGLKASTIQLATTPAPAVGDVWTATNTSGAGAWSGVPGAVDAVLPDYIMLDSLQQHYVTGSALAVGLSTSYHNNHAVVNSPGANGDSWEMHFVCASGIYNLRIVGSTNINAPKLDVFIDGVLQANIDWYSNPAVFNVTKSIFTGTLASGMHTLTCTVNGKNASSVGFALAINYYLLNP